MKHDITVVCVLRSGGDYTPEYVSRLQNGVSRHLKAKHRFICLTDVQVPCESVSIAHGWPGWWSKIELFRSDIFPEGLVIYFDLDTVIVGDISPLILAEVEAMSFFMLEGFHISRRWASGIMAWNNTGHLDDVYSSFHYQTHSRKYLNDQEWISLCGGQIQPIQSLLPGIVSYKHHCRGKGLPEEARVVCFHGNPRPHQVEDEWMKEYWR